MTIFKFLSINIFQLLILSSLISTLFTWIFGQLDAITDIVRPPKYPAPIQQMLFIFARIKKKANIYATLSKWDILV